MIEVPPQRGIGFSCAPPRSKSRNGSVVPRHSPLLPPAPRPCTRGTLARTTSGKDTRVTARPPPELTPALQGSPQGIPRPDRRRQGHGRRVTTSPRAPALPPCSRGLNNHPHQASRPPWERTRASLHGTAPRGPLRAFLRRIRPARPSRSWVSARTASGKDTRVAARRPAPLPPFQASPPADAHRTDTRVTARHSAPLPPPYREEPPVVDRLTDVPPQTGPEAVPRPAAVRAVAVIS
ncbi:hypothetical protein T484DRAFT_2319070 [Baffinella frigidus]|nr:hypothetical protein T484DRAFT_2319070 [Cryptophyta sp. CCMP2293]